MSKMIPVTKLTANFLHQQIEELMQAISEANGTVLALICHNHRTNQSLFNKIPTLANKPWRTSNDLFLLYDYGQIVKNIRNNWITEKTQELVYDDDGVTKTAKWSHLIELYKAEASDSILQLSKLTEKSVTPKHTEKQSVPLCLQVFCDETATALLTHSATKDLDGMKRLLLLSRRW